MPFLVPIALIGWIPLVFLLFMLLPPRRAVIAAFLVAWLFLPMAEFRLGGLPDYTKMSATCMGVLLAAAVFDADRLLSFRFSWIDIPISLFCIAPLFSSLSNGLGLYDGVSAVVRQTTAWGLPYLIGRVYFTDLESIRELAIGIVIGGLIYVPLCWLEIRLSPQLHKWVYGYYQHSFAQTKRFGGWRPMVFMEHGLMVAMWMSLSAMIGIWLTRAKSFNQLWGIPTIFLVPLLAFTALLCKSSYAVLLLMIGVAALYLTHLSRLRLFVIAMLMVAPVFILLRATLVVEGTYLVEVADQLLGPDRAQSLEFRFENENALSQRALEQKWFGWGGWGRARVRNDVGESITTTDSLWIITLGEQGIVGVVALLAMLLLPMALTLRDYRPDLWAHPRVAPVVALAMLLLLYMLDHLMNAMVNPIFMLACGGVNAVHLWAAAQRRLAAQYARATGYASPQQPGLGAGMGRPQPA